jgi:hypothetical protein
MWETQDWPIPGINEDVRGFQKTADPAMTVAGGALVIADKRELVVMDCNPEKPERLAAFRVGLIRWSMPVVANGRLYVRQGGRPAKLLCYDVGGKGREAGSAEHPAAGGGEFLGPRSPWQAIWFSCTTRVAWQWDVSKTAAIAQSRACP